MKRVVLALLLTLAFAGAVRADEGDSDQGSDKNIGFNLTATEIGNLRDNMASSQSMQKALAALKQCQAPDQAQTKTCKETAAMFPNATLNADGDAHVVVGQTAYDYTNSKLTKYTLQTPAAIGLQYTLTFNGATTLFQTKDAKGSFITASINHEHPENSHIVDADLPAPLKSSLKITGKAVVSALDDFYREKVSPDEIPMRAMIIGMLTNPAGQDGFIRFCEGR